MKKRKDSRNFLEELINYEFTTFNEQSKVGIATCVIELVFFQVKQVFRIYNSISNLLRKYFLWSKCTRWDL